MGAPIDLTGRRFGMLLVLKQEQNKGKRRMWLCRCDCGNLKVVSASHLLSTTYTTRSCGCLLGESHKKSKDKLYTVWANMKQRCTNPNNDSYKNYGGRGIEICDEWLNSFTTFYDWAIESGYDYSADKGKCTLERIDVNGNYCPSNCCWADMKTQRRNQRPYEMPYTGHSVECFGQSFSSITKLCKHYGVERRVVGKFIKDGVLPEKAIEIAMSKKSPVAQANLVQVDSLDESERGQDGFGSTGVRL